MGNILWDMIEADQFSAIYLLKDSSRANIKTEDLRLYQQVFRMHGISRDEFRKSFTYYEDHPDLIRTLFDTLLSRGNRLRTESYSKPVPGPQPPVTPAPSVPPVKTPANPVKAMANPSVKPVAKPPVKAPVDTPAKVHTKASANNKRDSSLQKRRPPLP
jgi:hypothetical protein